MLEAMLVIIYSVLGAVLLLMAVRMVRAFRQARPPVSLTPLANETDLPSVTVCIPARNEQHALTECLERVIDSKYEKLEILVLDDNSIDNTSILIKSFAHAGVRFVKGGPLPEGWLGRNYALQGLLDQASGSYILFMDVDTLLDPMAIENVVRYALSKRASMVSVVPRREDGLRASIVASPLRFFWELLFHRKNAPAAAGNAWLVNRRVLDKRLGGFTSHQLAVQPESQIAAELAQSNEYRFLVGTPAFGFRFEKKWRSQLETSIRSLFPLFGSQVSMSLVALLDLLPLLIPFVFTVAYFFTGLPLYLLPALILHLGFVILYGYYAKTLWRHGWVLGALLWPYILLQEALLIVASIIQHKRDAVTWKGRSVKPSKASL